MATPINAEMTAMLGGVLLLIFREMYKSVQDKKIQKQQIGYFIDIKESIDELHAITKSLSEKAVENALRINTILARLDMYEKGCNDHRRHQEELNRSFDSHISCLHDKIFDIVAQGIIKKEAKGS